MVSEFLYMNLKPENDVITYRCSQQTLFISRLTFDFTLNTADYPMSVSNTTTLLEITSPVSKAILHTARQSTIN